MARALASPPLNTATSYPPSSSIFSTRQSPRYSRSRNTLARRSFASGGGASSILKLSSMFSLCRGWVTRAGPSKGATATAPSVIGGPSTLTSPGGPCSILAPLAAQSSGEIWALSVDDREVDSVVVDEGKTDELASDVRIGLSAGGGSHLRTRLWKPRFQCKKKRERASKSQV